LISPSRLDHLECRTLLPVVHSLQRCGLRRRWRGGTVGTSDNGLTWDQIAAPLNTVYGLAWGANRFVAVGTEGRIYTAP